jgi:electron transfer flavoprotein alpha subunit
MSPSSLLPLVCNSFSVEDDAGWLGGGGRKPAKKKGGGKTAVKPRLTLANKAMELVDVSKVETTSKVLSKARIHVLSYGKGIKSKESIARLVKQHGGEVRPLPS